MSKNVCSTCGLQLVRETLQLRSDDEAPALVLRCPTHGIHHDTYSKYSATMERLTTIVEFNPSRQYAVSDKLRAPIDEHMGFLCCCSCPVSAATKGMTRYLTSGAVIRCYNSGVNKSMMDVINALEECACECVEAQCVFDIAGIKTSLCRLCADIVINICKHNLRSSPHSMTFHSEDDNNYRLSFCTGTVMRSQDGMWVDSKMLCAPPSSYEQVTSTIVGMIPFLDYLEPTRAGMLCGFINQSVCSPMCLYDATRSVVPLYSESPIMIPEHTHDLEANAYKTIPGLNLFVVFMNMDLTYEDGIVLSSSAASKFKYLCVKRVVLHNAHDIPELGSTIGPFSRVWWQIGFESKLVSIAPRPDGGVLLSLEYVGFPVDGAIQMTSYLRIM